MMDVRNIKRYTAYYRGWCIAFGEHEADYQEERDINWLFGEDKVGMIFSSGLRKKMKRELLRQHEEIPEFAITDSSIRMNTFSYQLGDDIDKQAVQLLKKYLLRSDDLHMYLCSHLFYPAQTRIITFSRKKPIVIMYKEMQPLKLVIE